MTGTETGQGHHGLKARARRWARRIGRRRFVVQAALDVTCWMTALVLMTWVRYDLRVEMVRSEDLIGIVLLAIGLQIIIGYVAGLYRGRWRYGSFDEVAALMRTAAMIGVLLFVLDRWFMKARPVPLSVPISGSVLALVLMGAGRYLWRLALERARRPSADASTRLLIFGAGEGGHQVVSAMMRDPTSRYFPVAFVDDDPLKRHLAIMGVRVMGRRDSIGELALSQRADALLIAAPSADAALITEISELAGTARLPVKVLPPVSDLYGAGVGLADIRDLQPADLLGRHQVEIDLTSIAGYLTGKRVLITGAGGSIGSELCRQIDKFAPAEMIMVDRDESALHGVQLALEGRALLDSPDLVLGDIRDRTFVRSLFAARRPHVVFHAAALKHLPLLEAAPGEAVQTNVWGTLTVLEAAALADVERFVNISTDKAADPTSVLGYTKRIAERLTAAAAADATGVYLSVRFGNVLGSRGSVLTAFRAQVDAGGPITVTDPEVTRYFMTVQESVELVIQAGAIGSGGEALVLDMGQPVRIADVAARMAAQASRPVHIVYTGLRPGEKLHEVLLGSGEGDERPIHPMISHVPVPALAAGDVRELDPWGDPVQLTAALAAMAQSSLAAER